jgi:hypothetical protein
MTALLNVVIRSVTYDTALTAETLHRAVGSLPNSVRSSATAEEFLLWSNSPVQNALRVTARVSLDERPAISLLRVRFCIDLLPTLFLLAFPWLIFRETRVLVIMESLLFAASALFFFAQCSRLKRAIEAAFVARRE